MSARGIWAAVAGLLVLVASFVFSKVQGGFVPWFMFYFCLVLALYEALTGLFGIRFIETARHLSATRLSAGQPFTVQVDVRRRHRFWPLFWIRLREDLPQRWQFQAQGLERVLQPLWTKAFAFTYQVDGVQRGVYRLGDTALETGDLFGLIRRTRVDTHSDEVIVYPSVVPVRGWSGYQPEELGLRQPTSRRAEESTNVLGVREYVPGDRLSRIHWPASARRGALQAKEFELHVSNQLIFLPDLSQASFQGVSSAVFELEMTIVASLMKHAYELRRQFGATLHGKQLANFAPGADEALFLRCMEALAMASPNGQTDYAQTLTRVAQETPGGTTLVVVSPRLDKSVAVAAESARRRTKVEWFVPTEGRALNDRRRQGLAMLQAARVTVHLVNGPDQLSSLMRGGGMQRATQW